MLFSAFQYLSDMYWGKRWNEKIFWFLVIFSFVFFVYYSISVNVALLHGLLKFISPIFIINFSKFQTDFGLIFATLQVIAMFFGFGIAFVGSQSIQYSLTKILLRYGYFQILSINFILIFLYYFTYNYDCLLIILITLWLSLLYTHTFFLMDKVFEPEEIIVDVLIPGIIHFENASFNKHIRGNKKRGNKNSQSSLYEILKGWKDKKKPLIYNEAGLVLPHSNAELDAWGKAIKRLAEKNSLKLNHLIHMLFHLLDKNEVQHAKIHSRYKNECDIKTYIWFLLAYLIYNLFEFIDSSPRYENLRGELLLQIVTRVLAKEYYSEQSGPFFSPFEDHISLFNFSNFKDKEIIIDFINTYLEDQEPLYVPNKNEQIAKFTNRLINSYVFLRLKDFSISKKLNSDELKYLLALMKLANTVYSMVGNLELEKNFTRDFLVSYMNLLAFTSSIDDTLAITQPLRIEYFEQYIQNIFTDDWERNMILLTKLVNGEMVLVGFNREGYKDLMGEALENLLKLNIEIPKPIRSRIKSIIPKENK